MLLLANAYCGLAPNRRLPAGQLAGGWLAAFPFFLVYGMNVVAWEDLVKLISGIKKADTEPDTRRPTRKGSTAHREGLGDGRQGPSRTAAPRRRSWRAGTARRPACRARRPPYGERRYRRRRPAAARGRRRRRTVSTGTWTLRRTRRPRGGRDGGGVGGGASPATASCAARRTAGDSRVVRLGDDGAGADDRRGEVPGAATSLVDARGGSRTARRCGRRAAAHRLEGAQDGDGPRLARAAAICVEGGRRVVRRRSCSSSPPAVAAADPHVRPVVRSSTDLV